MTIYDNLDPTQLEAVKYGNGPLLIVAGPGSGKCVLPTSKIVVNDRLMGAEQIWEQFATEPVRDVEGWISRLAVPVQVDSFDEALRRFSLGNVSALYRQFVRETIRTVRFSSGASVGITCQHKLYTGLDWTNEVAKKAFAIPRRLPQRSGCVDLDLAELLGWIISEGYEREATFEISQASVVVLRRIQDLAISLMHRNGIEPGKFTVKPDERRPGLYALTFHSAAFREYLRAVGHVFGVLSGKRCVPTCIMSANELAVRKFLCSLYDGDGWVEANRACIGYCSASEQLVKEVQHLLWRFGVWSRACVKMKCATNGARIKRPYHYLYVSGPSLRVFTSEIGFGLHKKQQVAERCSTRRCNPNRDLLPSDQIIADLVRVTGLSSKQLVDHSDYTYKRMSRPFYARARDRMLRLVNCGILASNQFVSAGRLSTKAKTAIRIAIEELDCLADSDLVYDDVEEVVEQEYEGWVYDFCVDKTHNFIADGVLCHNTRVLTHRAAHLIRTIRVQPSNILATTFTKKAAEEMRARLSKLVGPSAQRIWVGTVHSLCNRLLRDCGPQRVGLADGFSIYDEGESATVVNRIVRELTPRIARQFANQNYGARLEDFFNPSAVRETIAEAKERGFSPDEFAKLSRKGAYVKDFYREYNIRLRAANAADFGDLQLLMVEMLRKDPDVLRTVQQRFRYVLVDEYQDTNDIQAELFGLLAGGHKNITAVGDLDQCIPEGELVSTPYGPVPIESVSVGTEVLAAAGKTVVPAKVTHVMSSHHSRILEFTTSSGRILRCTPNHIVFTAQGSDYESVEAAQLQIGMALVVKTSEGLVLEQISSRQTVDGEFTCYDLEVDRYANYFVQGICVHNSIYRFRFANPENIRTFDQEWENPKVVLMGMNYRSTANIVKAAAAVIANNPDRFELEFRAQRGEGDPVRIVACRTEDAVALTATQLVTAHYSQGVPLSEMAVLYRFNRASRALESAFRLRAIPYTVVGGIAFYERREIKDILAWLRLLLNPNDVEAFGRASKAPPRGVGATTVDVVVKYAAAENINLIEAARRMSSLRKAQRDGLIEVATLWDSFLSMRDDPDLVSTIVSMTGYAEFLAQEEDGKERQRNLTELINSYTGFCQQILSIRDKGETAVDESNVLIDVMRFQRLVEVDSEKDKPSRSAVEAFLENTLLTRVEEQDSSDTVQLSTVHSAKGKEYKVVIVVGCEEGTMPPPWASANEDELEEERRVFYVAATRAKDHLYLLHAREGMQAVRGRRMAYTRLESSSFLFEAKMGGAVEVDVEELPRPRAGITRIVSKGKVVAGG